MRLIDRIDPRLKLVWCIVLLFSALLTSRIVVEVVILLLIFVTDALFTRNLKAYKGILVVFLAVASQIFLMQLLFHHEGYVIAQWWIFPIYSEALAAACLGTLRTVAVSCAMLQFLTRTSADDAVLMLVAWKIPYQYAMLITMAQRFLPLLKEEYDSIVQSQAVRGIPMDGIKNKIKVLPATFLPFLYRAVQHTSEIALSMELRGFGRTKQRTFMKDLHLSFAEAAVMISLVLFFLCFFLFL